MVIQMVIRRARCRPLRGTTRAFLVETWGDGRSFACARSVLTPFDPLSLQETGNSMPPSFPLSAYAERGTWGEDCRRREGSASWRPVWPRRHMHIACGVAHRLTSSSRLPRANHSSQGTSDDPPVPASDQPAA